MKTTLITLVLLFIGQGLISQELELSGKVDEHIQSVTVKVFNSNTLDYDVLVTIEEVEGGYMASLAFDSPNLYQIDFSGVRTVTMSFTEEKNVQVNFLNDEVTISGSEISADMQLFQQQNGALQQKHFAQLKKDADEAMQSGDQEALKDIQRRSEFAIANFLPELRSWIESKGIGPAGYQALQFSDFNKELEYIAAHLENFEKEIPNSPVTKALAAQVYRSQVLSVGQIPPAISAKDSEGLIVDLSSYNGKVLLVDFWAAWCRACRIENPQFVDLYNEYHSSGFDILSISQDKKRVVWQNAIQKDGVGIWRQVQDKNGAISDLYAISSLPQNILIGKGGRIIGKNLKAEDLKTILKKTL